MPSVVWESQIKMKMMLTEHCYIQSRRFVEGHIACPGKLKCSLESVPVMHSCRPNKPRFSK